MSEECIIKVERKKETKHSTMGTLYLNGVKVGYTLELPWNKNASQSSRIPAGTYSAFVRKASSSKWNYNVIELKNVPGRSNIQIHKGNYPSDTSGCILPGKTQTTDRVWESGKAFAEVINKAEKAGGISVIVIDKIK